jgi:hypothetical protein
MVHVGHVETHGRVSYRIRANKRTDKEEDPAVECKSSHNNENSINL